MVDVEITALSEGNIHEDWILQSRERILAENLS
ncbi:hypothetical protein J2Y60_001676 [Arcicella sp. BE140]|nr:hypothetical protein [Arcicella sp. BE51]MDR6811478.1 hypothetical protein [Arcicella sp. BE140]MDR6826018.1 hypothetical protein [Arcicella sp. BE139]